MDRSAKLKEALIPFVAECKKKGRPLDDTCLEEAYVGDASTSYILQVKARWVDDLSCTDALEFLFDVLWDTTSEEIRRQIFMIEVIDSKDKLHCEQDIPTAKATQISH